MTYTYFVHGTQDAISGRQFGRGGFETRRYEIISEHLCYFMNHSKDNSSSGSQRPLADRMRPQDLDEFVGQEELIGAGKILRRAIEEDRCFSMLLWGPPGTGKTTLAGIISERSRSRFVPYSAVTAGVKEIKEVAARAREDLDASGLRTILFLDEIHRFNKSQQDYLLPHVENGTILLIGRNHGKSEL